MYTKLRHSLLVSALLTGCGGPPAARSVDAGRAEAAAVVVDAARDRLPGLAAELARLAATPDSQVGICVQAAGEPAICVNGDQAFSLQSVMKLVVGMVVLDAVEQGKLKLEDAVLVERKDASLGVQPVMDKVGAKGYATTIGELVELAIIDSDSAAVDILVGRLGGMAVVQAWLRSQGVEVRIDRLEKELQAETSGLTWRPEYADEKVFARAEAKVSEAESSAAFATYLKDPRDRATPRGMNELLRRLADGKLLPVKSTSWLLAIMERTRTGPDRLAAGLPAGWKLAHKTGTSGRRDGVKGAVNDVGLLTAPDGTVLAISVFVAESKRDDAGCAQLIADAARAVGKSFR